MRTIGFFPPKFSEDKYHKAKLVKKKKGKLSPSPSQKRRRKREKEKEGEGGGGYVCVLKSHLHHQPFHSLCGYSLPGKTLPEDVVPPYNFSQL